MKLIVFSKEKNIKDLLKNYREIEDYEAKAEYILSNPELLIRLTLIPQYIQEILVKRNPSIFPGIQNPSRETIKQAVSIRPGLIRYVENPDEEIQRVAVQYNPVSASINIKNPTEKVQLEIIKGHQDLFSNIKNPTEKTIELAAKKGNIEAIEVYLSSHEVSEYQQRGFVLSNPYSIKFIENPSIMVQKLVVRSTTPDVFKYIKNPAREVQILALQKDGHNIQYIEKPDEELREIAIEQSPSAIQYIRSSDKNLWKKAISKNISVISLHPNPDEELQRVAVEINAELAIHFIPENKITENVLKRIMEKFPGLLQQTQGKYQPESAIWEAIKKDATLIRYVDHPNQEMLLYCVKNLPSSILMMRPEHITPIVEIEAVKRNPALIKYMTNPSEKAKNYAEKITRLESTFRPELLEKKYIPSHLNPDQMALWRWFDLNNRNEISSKELKRLSFGNTPYFQELIKKKQGKDITRQDILQSKKDYSGLFKSIKDYYKLAYTIWRGSQVIFKRKNHVMIMYYPKEEMDKLPEDLTHEQFMPDQNGTHPKLKDNPTIGWVRYTLFDKNVWIDEIQSDLFKSLPDNFITEIKGLFEFITSVFIREMRKRGYQKIYLPSFEVKRKYYKSNPPVSIYKDLPRKFRFIKTKLNFKDFDLPIDEKKPDDFEGWVLAKNKGN